MVSATFSEQAALDSVQQGWLGQGYTLVRDPAPHQLPAFLRHVRPDAIAIGRAPALLIEVLTRLRTIAESRNALVQGQIDFSVSSSDIRCLIELDEQLLS